jgi:hypothetical protein
MASLYKLYSTDNLVYKFNLKQDLPNTYKRLIKFVNEHVPPVYAKLCLDIGNIAD